MAPTNPCTAKVTMSLRLHRTKRSHISRILTTYPWEKPDSNQKRVIMSAAYSPPNGTQPFVPFVPVVLVVSFVSFVLVVPFVPFVPSEGMIQRPLYFHVLIYNILRI